MKNPIELFKNDLKGCYLLTDRFYRRYFSGIDLAEGYALLTADGVTYFADARYFSAVKPKLQKLGVRALLYKGLESLKDFILDNGYDKIFVDFETTTVSEFEEYKTILPLVLDGSVKLKSIRSVKDGAEIASVKKACQITQTAYYELLKSVREGITELQLKTELCESYFRLGAEGESFDTIVAFGENSAVPHHETGDTKLKKGMPILIDTGCKVNGYCSDYTRTAFFGTPDKKFIDCYNAVKTANERAIANIKRGTACNQADGYARDYLKEKGLAEYFTHSLGHGLGLEIHEYPTLSPKKRDILTDGTVFTIEPGVYFDGEFGIRIEDVVALTDGEVERFYTDDKELIIL